MAFARNMYYGSYIFFSLPLVLLLRQAIHSKLEFDDGVLRKMVELVVILVVGVGLIHLVRGGRGRHCYLVEFTCYKPPVEREVNTELSVYFKTRQEPIDQERLSFEWKIYLHSGLGEQTCAPSFMFNDPSLPTLCEAQMEMEECFVGVLDELFAKSCVEPSHIAILIVTVSTFGPAPSLTSWIVHHYKMKENVKTFSLSGMGCSSSVIAVEMARDLLKSYPDSYALLVGSENITLSADYAGHNKNFMLANSLFRVGGNAVLLSNIEEEAKRAKMRLLHTVRVNAAAEEEAYTSVMVKEDEDGIYGIGLRPWLLKVAGDTLRKNLATLAPKVLPLTELLYYVYINMVCIKLLRMKKLEPYVPNFRMAFQHFCIHPGGRAVIGGIGKSLGLSESDLEASRMALFRFGNTSTSGVWYEAAYLEAKRRFKAGNSMLQVALGSGFKCNTAVWKVMRDTHPLQTTVWDDCIHRYPCNTRKNYTDDFCDQLFHRLRQQEATNLYQD